MEHHHVPPPPLRHSTDADIVLLEEEPLQTPPPPMKIPMTTSQALYDYQSDEEGKLSFRQGDLICILRQEGSGWWNGVRIDPLTQEQTHGWFPATYVREIKAPTGAPPPAPHAQRTSIRMSPATMPLDISIDLPPALISPSVSSSVSPSVSPSVSETNKESEEQQKPVLQPSQEPAEESLATPQRAGTHLKRRARRTNTPTQKNGHAKLLPIETNVSGSTAIRNKSQWESYAREIARCTSRLSTIAESQDTDALLNTSKDIVTSIKAMLDASRTLEDGSLVLQESEHLAKCRGDMMSSLSDLVHIVRIVCRAVAAEDVKANALALRTQIGSVLLAVRNFVTCAMDSNIDLKPRPHSMIPESPMSVASHSMQTPVADKSLPTSPNVALERMSLEPQTPLSAYPASVLDDLDLEDLFGQLDAAVLKIKGSVDHLASTIQVDDPCASDRFVNGVKDSMTFVGDLVSTLDRFPLDTIETAGSRDSDQIRRFQDLRKARSDLSSSIAALIHSMTMASDTFAPPGSLQQVLQAISVVMRRVKDTVITTKSILEHAGRAIASKGQSPTPSARSSISRRSVARSHRRARSLESIADVVQSPHTSTIDATTIDRLPKSPSVASLQPTSEGLESALPASIETDPSDSNDKVPTSIFDGSRRKNSKSPLESGKKLRKFFGENVPSENSESSKLNKFFGESVPTNGNALESSKLKKFFGENILSSPVQNHEPSKARKFFGESLLPAAVKDSLPTLVRRRSSAKSWMGPDYTTNDIVFQLDGSNRVKAGTLDSLISRLTSHDDYGKFDSWSMGDSLNLDNEFASVFLLTFRQFTTAEVLVGKLRARFNLQPPTELSTTVELKYWKERKQRLIQQRVYKVVRKWMEDFWYDAMDRNVLPSVQQFASDDIIVLFPKEAERILELCSKRSKATVQEVQRYNLSLSSLIPRASDMPAPPPILPRFSRHIKFTDLDPLEAARQLTATESEKFNAIHPVDCLFYRPDNSKLSGTAPPKDASIRAMIQHSNEVTGWVAEMVLLEKDVKKRAYLIKHFIKIAEKCHILNNFATREAILSALNSTSIYRLKQTWEMVSPKTKASFDSLMKFMDRDHNFATYRSALRTASPPCIPFFGRF